LAALFQLSDTVRIDEFATQVSAAGNYRILDNIGLEVAMSLLSHTRAAELIQHIVATNMAKHSTGCADLLARMTAVFKTTETKALLRPAAQILLDNLPDSVSNGSDYYWQKPSYASIGFVVQAVVALERIDLTLALQIVKAMLSRPAYYDFDKSLVPAALKLMDQSGEAVVCLRNACLDHLAKRIAEPLEPPSDWTRESTIKCDCEDCQTINRFLADPDTQSTMAIECGAKNSLTC
jgi:hypothetical protein